MQFTSTILAGMAIAGSAVAQNMSICDKYTTALLKDNTAEQQMTVLTLLVNTVVIGNYTKPSIPGVMFPDVMVPGILANGTVNGTKVNLLPYFNGGLASSNRGDKAVAVNFLDDGGAVPLMMNKPANGTDSNQYFLLTHLYQFFGTLLGCSKQGMGNYSAYQGEKSMYKVHKFMDLTAVENTYFISQVGLAAKSFGVTDEDITAVAMTLDKAFNKRCSAPVTLAPALGSQLQSICTDSSCPLAMNNTCSMYENGISPGVANSSLAMGEGNSSNPATSAAPNGGKPTSSAGSGSASMSSSMGGAAQLGSSGIVAAIAGFLMLL